jgi:hypothetical protein
MLPAIESVTARIHCPLVQNPRGLRENVAWKDFCEDIRAAVDSTNGKAQEIASQRGAILDPACFD